MVRVISGKLRSSTHTTSGSAIHKPAPMTCDSPHRRSFACVGGLHAAHTMQPVTTSVHTSTGASATSGSAK